MTTQLFFNHLIVNSPFIQFSENHGLIQTTCQNTNTNSNRTRADGNTIPQSTSRRLGNESLRLRTKHTSSRAKQSGTVGWSHNLTRRPARHHHWGGGGGDVKQQAFYSRPDFECFSNCRTLTSNYPILSTSLLFPMSEFTVPYCYWEKLLSNKSEHSFAPSEKTAHGSSAFYIVGDVCREQPFLHFWFEFLWVSCCFFISCYAQSLSYVRAIEDTNGWMIWVKMILMVLSMLSSSRFCRWQATMHLMTTIIRCLLTDLRGGALACKGFFFARALQLH